MYENSGVLMRTPMRTLTYNENPDENPDENPLVTLQPSERKM